MRDLNPVMSVRLARYTENINSIARESAILLHLQREVHQPKRPAILCFESYGEKRGKSTNNNNVQQCNYSTQNDWKGKHKKFQNN